MFSQVGSVFQNDPSGREMSLCAALGYLFWTAFQSIGKWHKPENIWATLLKDNIPRKERLAKKKLPGRVLQFGNAFLD